MDRRVSKIPIHLMDPHQRYPELVGYRNPNGTRYVESLIKQIDGEIEPEDNIETIEAEILALVNIQSEIFTTSDILEQIGDWRIHCIVADTINKLHYDGKLKRVRDKWYKRND